MSPKGQAPRFTRIFCGGTCCRLTDGQICNTLVVDVHPDYPSTASAAVSMVRCLVAAVGVSVLQLLFDAIGVGWTFSLFSGLCISTTPMLLVARRYSPEWRKQRELAEKARKEKQASTL